MKPQGFPHKNIFGFPRGWKDLGEALPSEKNELNRWGESISLKRYDVHDLCKSRLHIAKQDNELFKFCPRCMVRVE